MSSPAYKEGDQSFLLINLFESPRDLSRDLLTVVDISPLELVRRSPGLHPCVFTPLRNVVTQIAEQATQSSYDLGPFKDPHLLKTLLARFRTKPLTVPYEHNCFQTQFSFDQLQEKLHVSLKGASSQYPTFARLLMNSSFRHSNNLAMAMNEAVSQQLDARSDPSYLMDTYEHRPYNNDGVVLPKSIAAIRTAAFNDYDDYLLQLVWNVEDYARVDPLMRWLPSITAQLQLSTEAFSRDRLIWGSTHHYHSQTYRESNGIFDLNIDLMKAVLAHEIYQEAIKPTSPHALSVRLEQMAKITLLDRLDLSDNRTLEDAISEARYATNPGRDKYDASWHNRLFLLGYQKAIEIIRKSYSS